jgi:hypothetical protein
MAREGTNHGMGWGGGTEVHQSRDASEAVLRASTHRWRYWVAETVVRAFAHPSEP